MPKQRNKLRNELIREVRLMLGDGMIDIELDPDHYDLALDLSFSKLKQRSENVVQEDFYFIELKEEVDEYSLPAEVVEVQKIWDRAYGRGVSSGIDMDPFELAYANTYFMTNNHLGGMATYDAFAQYRETLNKISGTDIGFSWNTVTKKLKLFRKMKADSLIALHVFLEKSEDQLVQDPYLRSWIREYTLAQCKRMLGEARSKFSSLPGAQGGVTLNGIEMKSEADAMLEKLDYDLTNYTDGSAPLGFIIG